LTRRHFKPNEAFPEETSVWKPFVEEGFFDQCIVSFDLPRRGIRLSM